MNMPSFSVIGANFLLLLGFSVGLDSISPLQSMKDGDETLVSGNGRFELSFFSPGLSKNRYLGIQYKNMPATTVVWVANRSNSTGNLAIVNANNSVVWSTNTTTGAKRPVVQLLDSGNLVLIDQEDGNYLWQSFDYPSDTLLPGMKLGWDLKRGLNRRLISWRSADDPAPGDFTWGVELEGNPELVMRKGTAKFYRSGPWNGIGLNGGPDLKPNPVFDYDFVSNKDEVYYINTYKYSSAMLRMVMNQTINSRQRYAWSKETKSWGIYASVPRDYCDTYALCGAYGNCIISSMPVCQCLDKFSPRVPDRWNALDWTQGCVRNKPLTAKEMDLSNMKGTMNLEECRNKCLQNCSCMAYSNTDVSGGGSGCAIWFGDLIDIRQYPAEGQDIYIRVNASEIEIAESNRRTDQNNDGRKDELELPLFEFTRIVDATSNFSIHKKLGEGGFGPVYRGTLQDGQEIAVKRLSRDSGQGLNEFMNEVMLITKLQHRNLVKLLGCCMIRYELHCIHGEERMLIYEYMPNKSLDYFIFDQTRSKQLDWPKRFDVIYGIARGILYLHQDSRLRIIHRDLKASNVLLDEEMNPKISDFGVAKTFGKDQTVGNTGRVVGTFGYMAPEYATDGLFSVKSDVFSFGILVLEIISGRKSKGFFHPNNSLNIILVAWRIWKEGNPSDLVDASSRESCNTSELMRCIHISLLCVQQHPEDRPGMETVVMMLGGENALPLPREPEFINHEGPLELPDLSSNELLRSLTNKLTVSLVQPR
ncbi:hypothetical protein Tsubulata_032373 [Turnera subulata]|uniref:Receptor-like serine/threonine-protein kinase n=1 Tax=Turnera subulata TaxID=218843 RepID=A0A9Q0JBG5_9ROSI|nr:hypothetical protein Tsubulata_032373 [Turnera subulata]